MLYPKRYWDQVRIECLNIPVLSPSCDKCAWINMTEDEQESLAVLGRHHIPFHMCTYYDKRVIHDSRMLQPNHDIYPCDECVKDNHINFISRKKER